MSKIAVVLSILSFVALTGCNYEAGSRRPGCETVALLSGPEELSNLCGDRFPLSPYQPEAAVFTLQQGGRYSLSQQAGVVRIAEVRSGKFRLIDLAGQVVGSDLSPDGSTVVMLTYNGVRPVVTRAKLRGGFDGNEADIFTCHPIQEQLNTKSIVSGPSSIALSDDGDRAVFGSSSGSVLLDFESADCQLTLLSLNFASFFRDRSHFAGVNNAGNAFVWNAADGTVRPLGFVTMTPPIFDRSGSRAIISRPGGWLDPLYQIGIVHLGDGNQILWQHTLTSAAAIGRFWFLSEG